MTANKTITEIRARNVSPELVRQLQAIGVELKDPTVTGIITKMIPRYHDMKKRISEQNTELGKLSQELRTANYRLSEAREQLETFASTLNAFIKHTAGTAKKIQDKAKTFGTKKSRPALPGNQVKRKKVPTVKKKPAKKKPITKTKKKK